MEEEIDEMKRKQREQAEKTRNDKRKLDLEIINLRDTGRHYRSIVPFYKSFILFVYLDVVYFIQLLTREWSAKENIQNISLRTLNHWCCSIRVKFVGTNAKLHLKFTSFYWACIVSYKPKICGRLACNPGLSADLNLAIVVFKFRLNFLSVYRSSGYGIFIELYLLNSNYRSFTVHVRHMHYYRLFIGLCEK